MDGDISSLSLNDLVRSSSPPPLPPTSPSFPLPTFLPFGLTGINYVPISQVSAVEKASLTLKIAGSDNDHHHGHHEASLATILTRLIAVESHLAGRPASGPKSSSELSDLVKPSFTNQQWFPSPCPPPPF